MQKTVGIYHKGCIDGTTAAAIVLRKFPEARLFPLAHTYTQDDVMPILEIVDSETKIYTVDCGLGARAFLAHGYAVTTLDHHFGAKEEFEALAREYPKYTYIFDNEKSGASLSWSHFFPDEEMPEFVRLVEEADLWKGEFEGDSKVVNFYASIFRNNPSAMLTLLQSDISVVKEKGAAIVEFADVEIHDLVQLPALTLHIGAHVVPAYNVHTYVSSVGNILSGQLGVTVALFAIKGDKVRFSFRGKQGQSPSALALARALGGGGHELAAGATVPLADFIRMTG